MAKPCPHSTPNDVHPTHEVNLGPTCKYSYCEKCEEDVDYLAQGANKQWVLDDATQPEGPGRWEERRRPNAPALRPNNPVDEIDELDELDEDADFNPAVNPPNWNPRPVRNMGAGNHHIVLHNDDDSAAHLVMQILCDVFQKNMLEADYIMKGAHFNGQATVFQCADDAEAQRYLDRIDLAKQDIANSQAVGANTLGNLRFTVNVVNP